MWLRRTLLDFHIGLNGADASVIPPRTLLKMCAKHNSAMSSLLENAVSPTLKRLVQGQATTVQVHELPLLLSWMVKTSKLMDLVSFEEFARGERENFRGVMPYEDLRMLILNLITRGGLPLPTWATALAQVNRKASQPGAEVAATAQQPLQRLRYPDLTHISDYGDLMALTIAGSPEQVQEFIQDCSVDSRLFVIHAGSETELVWPPPVFITTGMVEHLRYISGHSNPMGWGADNMQLRRHASKMIQTVEIISDDAQNASGLAHAMRSGSGVRALATVIEPSLPPPGD